MAESAPAVDAPRATKSGACRPCLLLLVGLALASWLSVVDAARDLDRTEVHALTIWHVTDACIDEAPERGAACPDDPSRSVGVELPVVDLDGLDGTSLWHMAGLTLSYLIMLGAARWWLGNEPHRLAVEYYQPAAGNEFTREERTRRTRAVETWAAGYRELATWWMFVEAAVFAVVLTYGLRPSLPGLGEFEALVGAAYVLRLLVFIGIAGFAGWAWVRARLMHGLSSSARRAPTAAEVVVPAQKRESHRTVLALSGGGIRSAAFCLGAIDALQQSEEAASPGSKPAQWGWNEVDAVCAVSGGAYAAGALASHCARALQGHQGRSPDTCLSLRGPALRNIRNRSNYLAPGMSGKVRAFNIWGSGALVTLALYASAVALAGFLVGFVAALLTDDPRRYQLGIGALSVVLAGSLGVLQTIVAHLRKDPSQVEAQRRSGELFGWIWGLLAGFVFVVPTFLTLARWGGDLRDGLGGWRGMSVALLALVAGGGVAAARSAIKQARAPVATIVGGVIVPILTGIGLASAAYYGLTINPLHERATSTTVWWVSAIALVVLIALSRLDVVKVSLYPFYRDQLEWAFSTEHRMSDSTRRCEAPHPGSPVPLGVSADPGCGGRKTVICAAANVMSSPITPPGRGAVSFTFSADSVGLPKREEGPQWIDPAMLAHCDRGRSDGFPLFGAVAVSGAAVSPGMGKMTKRAYQALLALSNIRLGVWLPNPAVEHRPGRLRPPRMVPYFFKELFGLYNILDRCLYVSDGGHWDNLALVEALRLEPDTVVVLDSSGDPPGAFSTLGEAISLAESELPVEIDMDPSQLGWRNAPSRGWWRRDDPPPAGPLEQAQRCVAKGTARWLDGSRPDTRLIYCRAVVTQDAPVSIAAFAARHAEFPNHSTLRQIFDDQTFEAYRELGYVSGEHIRKLLTSGRHAVGAGRSPSSRDRRSLAGAVVGSSGIGDQTIRVNQLHTPVDDVPER